MLGHHKTTLFYVTEVTNDTTCYSNVQCYGLAHFIGRGNKWVMIYLSLCATFWFPPLILVTEICLEYKALYNMHIKVLSTTLIQKNQRLNTHVASIYTDINWCNF